MLDNEFSTYDLLDKVRAKPLMYLGEVSVVRLWMYVEGYRFALLERGFQEVTEPTFREFSFFVRAMLGQAPLSIGWADSILDESGKDGAGALELFYEMLDSYRSGEFPGVVEQYRND